MSRSDIHPPSPTQVRLTLDGASREAMEDARKSVASIVDALTPKRSGRMVAGLQPRVGEGKDGPTLTVGAKRGTPHGDVTLAQVVKWVTSGTGIDRVGGGDLRPIRSKRIGGRLKLPDGRITRSVPGQHANPFMARIALQATPVVEAAARAGAARAGRDIEGLFR